MTKAIRYYILTPRTIQLINIEKNLMSSAQISSLSQAQITGVVNELIRSCVGYAVNLVFQDNPQTGERSALVITQLAKAGLTEGVDYTIKNRNYMQEDKDADGKPTSTLIQGDGHTKTVDINFANAARNLNLTAARNTIHNPGVFNSHGGR